MATIQGVIHGKRIDLEREPGLPDGAQVTVDIRPALKPRSPDEPEPPYPTWMERFHIDPSVKVGKYVVKGTRLLVDNLVTLVEQGRSDEELRALHPELTAQDVDAVRRYAQLPLALRRSFGGGAEEAEEIDKFLEELRRLRRLPRRGFDQ
jgi:uncharacterized protein (DUF433 family)